MRPAKKPDTLEEYFERARERARQLDKNEIRAKPKRSALGRRLVRAAREMLAHARGEISMKG